MADRTFDQFRPVFPVASLAEGVGGIFKGGDFFRETRFTVMAGFTFFDFLSFDVRESLAFGALAVMTSSAFQSGLVRTMGKLRRIRRFCRING